MRLKNKKIQWTGHNPSFYHPNPKVRQKEPHTNMHRLQWNAPGPVMKDEAIEAREQSVSHAVQPEGFSAFLQYMTGF